MTPTAASKSQARRFAAQEAAKPALGLHMMAGGFTTMCGKAYTGSRIVDFVTYDLDKVTCTRCLLETSSKVTARIYSLVRTKATLKTADHFADVAQHEARALEDASVSS